MSGDEERDRELTRQDKEQVVPVSELKATISQMLKEALEEQRSLPGNSQDGDKRKGRETELSLGRLSRWDDRASRRSESALLIPVNSRVSRGVTVPTRVVI